MLGQVFLNLYEVTSQLGQGSMGRVYLARHKTTKQQVVLKLMHEHIAKQKRFRELFEREMECMLRFRHPGAVQLLDSSLKDPAGPCLVMEYVRGVDLEHVRKRQATRRFPPARVGRLIGQLCEVLHAAHGQGIIHCDLKPSNLMLIDCDRPLERLKVLDFGLARLVEDGPSRADKGMVGAPGYMSPERIKGQPQDHHSDIYSIGVLLYEMLTGRMPFLKPSVAEVLQAHLHETAPRFSERAPDLKVPPGLEAIVHICLAKVPGQRPDSVLDVARQLERVLGEKILGGGDPAPAAAPAPTVTPPIRPTPPLRPTPPQITRPTMPGVTANPTRPSRPTLPGTQPRPQPTRSTMQGEDAALEENELAFQLANSLPPGAALKLLADFVTSRGGKLVKQGSDEVRIYLAVDLYGTTTWVGRAQSTQSGSGQVVLTELEVRPDPAGPHLLRLSIRPMGALSKSLASAWQGRCEMMQIELQEALQAG